MLNCVAALSLREAARRSILFLPRSFLLSYFRSFPDKSPENPRKRFKKKKKKKDRLPHYSEYPKICPIFISSCLVCARACYTPHPSTPTHGKHFFIYFNIFSLLSFRLLLLLATRPLRRDARIIFPCAHAIFLFFFCKFIS